MELESAKNIGGVGAILLVIGSLAIFANSYGGLLSLAGIILVLIGLKGMADNYKEGGIINNALYSVVTAIVGGVVSIGVLVASVLVFLSNAPDWLKTPLQAGDWQGLSNAVQQHISIERLQLSVDSHRIRYNSYRRAVRIHRDHDVLLQKVPRIVIEEEQRWAFRNNRLALSDRWLANNSANRIRPDLDKLDNAGRSLLPSKSPSSTTATPSSSHDSTLMKAKQKRQPPPLSFLFLCHIGPEVRTLSKLLCLMETQRSHAT